jgi:hypothetical protein
MPFRYQRLSTARDNLPADPLARFVELYGSFEESRGFFEDKAPIRFAAATLATTPGEAADISERIRELQKALEGGFGFWTMVVKPLQLILAAVLHKRGDDPADFAAGFAEARETFRAHKLRRDEVYEFMAYTILRGQCANGPIPEERVRRVKDIYAALRGYHWFLTGPEDLPACAALAGTEETPSAIGEGTEALYQTLRKRAKWWPGEELHTASHIMFLSGVATDTITERAVRLCEGFRDRGYKIRIGDYHNVALLCMMAIPVERIVEAVLTAAQRIQDELNIWFGKAASFNLAVSIAFVELLQGDNDLERLSEVKTLLDMQAIIMAQQAGAT